MVAIVTMIIVSVIGMTTASDHQKRFLFNTDTNQAASYLPSGTMGQFCTFCPIRCKNGFVTSSTGCLLCKCKSSISYTGGSSASAYYQPNSHIYLSNPCQPHVRYCNINCPRGGLRLGQNGCQYCACAVAKTTTAPTPAKPLAVTTGTPGSLVSAYYQPNSHVYLSNPCQPHVHYCNIKCPRGGLLLGQNGCQYCACAIARITAVPTPPKPLVVTASTPAKYITPTISNVSMNHQPHELFLSKPCSPHIRYCPLRCVHGLKLGKNGCQYCACAANTSSTASPLQSKTSYPSPTVQAISSVTRTTAGTATTTIPTLPPNQKNKDFYDPCIPSQTTCNKDCRGNYVKGPQGCQYCICMSRVPESLRPITTIAPAVLFRPANETHHVDHHVMTEACIVAKAICQLNCPSGFLNTPDNCLNCTCASKSAQADDPAEEPGFMVRLPNPCVQRLDSCELLCTSGYLLGPRGCQFCTCRDWL